MARIGGGGGGVGGRVKRDTYCQTMSDLNCHTNAKLIPKSHYIFNPNETLLNPRAWYYWLPEMIST